jgi:F-type H+-transporting ATPase subunit delta
MEEVLLADKYAKALVACAREADLVDQLDIEMDMFAGILRKHARLGEILSSPLVSFREKRELLEAVFKGEWISPELRSFLLLLLEKKRFLLFGEISKVYKDLIYSLRKRLKVCLESPFALGARQKKALQNKLGKIYRQNIDLFVRLDPELIGGARLCVGHTLFDGTVRARLSLMREKLCQV